MEHLRYYLGFNLVYGVGPARLARLIARCGSVEAAWHASTADLIRCGLDGKTCAALVSARRSLNLDAELRRAEKAGVELLCWDDPSYPQQLLQTPAPPPLLYVRGSISAADAWAVAVVGTRSPSTYGREAARRISGDLAGAGVTVVSGLALGIDTIAHRSALEAGGRTIAVLACGVDYIYPLRNEQLAAQIVQAGAIISEFPLGTRPAPQLFPVRNRLISGLSGGVLVVEAGQQSGALITVEFALEQGRDVFAVPGSIFARTSEGTNQLIRNGAGLVTGAADILDALQMGARDAQQEARSEIPADPVEAALLRLLSAEPTHADELSRAASLPIAETTAALAMLELKGKVRQVAPMQFVLTRS